MSYLLAHTASFLGWVFLVRLAGLALRHRLARDLENDPYRGLVERVLGLLYWIVGLFVLASAGLFGGAGISLLVLGALLAGGRAARQTAWPWRSPRPAEWLAIAALGAFLLPIYFLTLTPVISWDADVYHLTLPRLFLEHGGFQPVEMSVYSTWPLNTELLFAAAMWSRSYVVAKLLHFGFGVAVLAALVAAGRRLGRPLAGFLAGAFFLANEVVLFELRSAYVDVAMAFFLLVVVLFLDRALEASTDGQESRWLLLAGLAAGLLAGVKLTGMVAVAAAAAIWLPRLLRRPATLRPFVWRFALPAALLTAPWLLRAWWLTGNPIYPFLWGGPDWSDRLATRFAAWQSSIGMGREPLDYLLLPLRVIWEGGSGYAQFDGRLGAFWLVLLPLGLWAARKPGLGRRLLTVAGLYFVTWALSSQQMRFLIPILPLLALASALALADLASRLAAPPRRGLVWATWGIAAALLLSAAGNLPAAGLKTARAFLAMPAEDIRASAVPPIFRFIDEHLPSESRILFLHTNRGFFCPRPYLADSFFEASQIADWLRPASTPDEVSEMLAGRGLTHVLVARRRTSADYPRALAALLADEARARVIFRSPDGSFALLELVRP